ncbi:MAG: carbamoyl-phosphate synthase large subunit, partial [Firmicutes bacterium]|nr:carbamoyl-phosphate synthase large subunit [Bacillota bacterium]
FLQQMAEMVATEQQLKQAGRSWQNIVRHAKRQGFSDQRIAELVGEGLTADHVRAFRLEHQIIPSYKMVDTCAGEFVAKTPYFYAAYDQYDEGKPLDGKKVVVLGSGPIRIGQGIEFDASSVYALDAIRAMGYQAIMMNSNPETVSTDFNMSDRLYFEPLTLEDVLNVVDKERPLGVMVQFGGQTAINLANQLAAHGVKILGTAPDDMDKAEDREQFEEVLEDSRILRPTGHTATTKEMAQKAAKDIGYPVLVRPSFVLGGRAMRIIDNADQLTQYLDHEVVMTPQQPLLVDRYMNGLELEVDAVSDGEHTLIPAVMEHVERAGVHSGDSVAVLPH